MTKAHYKIDKKIWDQLRGHVNRDLRSDDSKVVRQDEIRDKKCFENLKF